MVENVPGHVIPILEREFDDFDTESTRFLKGELEEDDFIKFRLKQGVYGQRQADVQMVRVKLPMGGVTPDQLDAFADVIEKYVPLRKGHITTRQNIQMHHIPLPDAAAAHPRARRRRACPRARAAATRCATSPATPAPARSRTSCSTSRPTPGAYVRYFVRHPTTQAMPRKVKTAFTANDEDNAITQIHDMAFTPRERDGVRGVEIRVGGGTSIMPRLAPVLYEFVELDNGDYLKVTEACMRIFDRQDFLRVNRARARIKVLIDKIGIDAFRDMVEEELEGDWVAERDFSLDEIFFDVDEEAQGPGGSACSTPRPTATGASSTTSWSPTSRPSARTGSHGRGQGPPRRPHARAAARRWARSCAATRGGSARTTVHQNLVLRWVRDESVYEVWQALREAGASATPAPTRSPTSSAAPAPTPASWGSPARWASTGPSRTESSQMDISDPLTRRIHIKMSGCPNGCSQHHIADIGFYGASIKVGDKTIPAYIPHIGGTYEGGEVRYGQRLKARLPAKRVPEAVERWVRFYESDRQDGELFRAFVGPRRRVRVRGAREGSDDADRIQPREHELLHRLQPRAPFEVIRGEGECAV